MRRLNLILGVLAVLIGVAAAALVAFPGLRGAEPVQTGTTLTEPDEVNSRAIAFVQPAYRDDYGNARVAGYVDNVGDTELISGTLIIELRDAEGNREAIVEHEVLSIPPGERKWFDIDVGTFSEPLMPAVVVESIEVAR